MKCSKAVLNCRKESERMARKHCLLQETASRWITSGYHGYSYKLRAGIKLPLVQSSSGEPQLTVSTLMFPEDMAFDAGASLERWTKKAPRLVSAKRKNYTPRRHALDDEYEFSYELSECFDDCQSKTKQNNRRNRDECSNTNINNNDNDYRATSMNFDDYCVASDINELIMKYRRRSDADDDENVVAEESARFRKEKSKKRNGKGGNDAQKKRKKYRKTIRFSFSKPPSPETEQVIRVEVTSNVVSFDETSPPLGLRAADRNDKGGGGKGKSIITSGETTKKDSRSGKFDGNNNERDPNNDSGPVVDEEDFIVKCRQLALTQKM